MNREDVLKDILNLKGKTFLFEIATGVGKTKLAIEKIKTVAKKGENLLIIVPKNVLKLSWKDEINKWWPENKLNISFSTYISLPKYAGTWDYIIFDEAHHLSERCRNCIQYFNIKKYSILLSATIKQSLKNELRKTFNQITEYKVNIKKAIDENILPQPKVYLLPIQLDNKIYSETIYKNKKNKGEELTIRYPERWHFIKLKIPLQIKCTQQQYYEDMSTLIEWYKKKYMLSMDESMKNIWLFKCNERLKWLSSKKIEIIKLIIEKTKEHRSLIFCNNIQQTELLSNNSINSKNKDAIKNLEDFNNGKINCITACNILNEGINLKNCQIGIYVNLNSSETMIFQKLGRLLRHKNPIIIIPYYKNTREQELVNKMLENVDKKNVKTINNINELIL